MNTILTDDALIDAIRKAGLRVTGPHKILARAVEAAVLAKLALKADRQRVPEGWLPTAENVNALPDQVRKFVHDLATNADPAGTVRDLTIAQDTIRALEASNRMLRDVAAEVSGCFHAAIDEGLQEALTETTDERLKDLVERRLMYAYPIADQAAAPEAPAQALPVGYLREFIGKGAAIVPLLQLRRPIGGRSRQLDARGDAASATEGRARSASAGR